MNEMNSCIICFESCEDKLEKTICYCEYHVHKVCLYEWRVVNNSCVMCKTQFLHLPIKMRLYRMCRWQNIYIFVSNNVFDRSIISWMINIYLFYFFYQFSREIYFYFTIGNYDFY